MTPRVGVVGHVEWVEFAVVSHVPAPGEILHARETFAEPAGGGAVAAVQLTRLAGRALFVAAVGDDELGRRAEARLREGFGVEVVAGRRRAPQRRAFTFLDDDHERTITVLGPRLVPEGQDPLPRARLAELDAVYFTGGDVEALRAARAARVLVATPRALDTLRAGHVPVDALVLSGTDPGEAVADGLLDPPPALVVRTRGGEGGEWVATEGRTGTWRAAALPGEPVDSYGSGDSFAAGLTFGLGAGLPLDQALAFAARCGAACLCGRGPYAAPMPAPPSAP
ncbi:MAG: PfkB family carbohydrate kinase [Actinomycetota bacterium]|nr:PfkB family carbohydrate kinase [Actinomycetota bacterium]